ncbi:hypothetical protein J3F84DRAFT_398302 [Trichoderma pleuroticola]
MGYTGWLKDTGKPDNKGQEINILAASDAESVIANNILAEPTRGAFLELQDRLRIVEDQVVAAQTTSENRVVRHEESVENRGTNLADPSDGSAYKSGPKPLSNKPKTPRVMGPVHIQHMIPYQQPNHSTAKHRFSRDEVTVLRIGIGRVIAASPNHESSLSGDKKRKIHTTNKRFCHGCKKNFPSRTSLDKHTSSEHLCPYICVFHYADCNARFDAKNRRKHHVSTNHLGLKYWRTDERQSSYQRYAGCVRQ